MNRPVLHFHQHIADLYTGTLGEAVFDLTANHALDDTVFINIVACVVDSLDGSTVTDNGDLISNIGDFVQLMGNNNTGHALFLELQQQVKKGTGIFFVQRGGRLVQDQQLCVLCQSLCDFDHLLLTNTDILDQGTGGFRQADDFQVLIGFAVSGVPVNGEGLATLVAQEHILTDGHIGNQRQLLVDDDDALCFGLGDFGELTNVSVVNNIARIRAIGINTAEDIHQRRFAGTVLADQGMDGAALHLQIHVVKSLDTGELFGDVIHFQNQICQAITSLWGFEKGKAASRLAQGIQG